MGRRVAAYAPDVTDWRRTLTSRDSFFPVLGLTLVCVAASPVIDSFKWGFVAAFPFLAFLMMESMRRSGVSPKVMHASRVLLVIAGAGTVITTYARHTDFGEQRVLVAITSFLFVLLYLVTIPAVVRRAFQHTRVTVNTLAAGITAYLLIGLMFSSAFRGVSALEHYEAFNDIANPSAGDYAYFSFVTLTTVGYGDLTPRTDAMRTLAVFEAILGQVFLVTAVARIVSLLGQQQERLPLHETSQPDHTFEGGSPD